MSPRLQRDSLPKRLLTRFRCPPKSLLPLKTRMTSCLLPLKSLSTSCLCLMKTRTTNSPIPKMYFLTRNSSFLKKPESSQALQPSPSRHQPG